jgi:NTE family protein
MLMELIASGVQPDFIVGVSAGALNGAFLAYQPTISMTESMARLWVRVRTRDVLRFTAGSVLGLIGMRGHLVSADGLGRLLHRELPYRRFEATAIPLHVVAADQHSGDEVLLSEGEIVEAVLASTAIPGVYPPVMLSGRALVDGVVASGTPIKTAIRLGATRITVVPCGFACSNAVIPNHALGRAMHAITLLGARQLKSDFALYTERAQICIVPPLCPLSQSAYDYSNGAQLVASARDSTRAWIDGGGHERSEFPAQLVAHTHSS